ncbi:MAG: flavoprotein [Phycisphaerales bacterium JB038]
MADSPFQDKTILVGLTGGIACYKTAYLVSKLTQAGAAVTVCMTEAATRFVAPLTFQALSGKPVYTSPWLHIESQDPQHVSTARSADLMIIAPCTMNMLAKLAIGRADDIVSLVAAALEPKRQPILIAPAMNEAMWQQASTQRNVAQLSEDGFHFVGPGAGWQACRTLGLGRMSEPEEILDASSRLLAQVAG